MAVDTLYFGLASINFPANPGQFFVLQTFAFPVAEVSVTTQHHVYISATYGRPSVASRYGQQPAITANYGRPALGARHSQPALASTHSRPALAANWNDD